jgi:cellulose biosynthesis protein BcsQ
LLLIDAVNALDRNVDFIVVDTPGTDSYLSRLAHSTADTLITKPAKPPPMAGRKQEVLQLRE